MEVLVVVDPAGVVADRIARRLRIAVARRGHAHLAVSGGSTAPPMLAALVRHRLRWSDVTVWQVDERVAPDRDPARNACQLDVLPRECTVRPMPVTAADLRAAARRYAAALPERLDVVHLGVGDDGHTASWPPGQPDTAASARAVEVVDRFNGWPRMTLTARVVNGARSRIVLTNGAAKRPMVTRWLAGDRAIPIAAVRRTGTLVVLDRAAAPVQPSR